ncbi:MAG: ATP-binding protein [Deferrisomatales bacterium]
MRSLFLRIFVSFGLAAVAIGAVLVALALTTDPRRAMFGRHEARLLALGGQLVAASRGGGALPEAEARRPGRGAAFLFRGAEGPLGGSHAPPMVRRLAAEAAATGERQLRPGRHGLWLALPLEEEYVLVAEVPPPSRLERLLDPYGLGLRLGAALAVILLASYLLARFLAAPIRELRRATRELAEGDLGARVGPALGGRQDETGALGRDFDRMAGRIEGLVGAQQRLLRDISHELRSPLARLNVALELARQKAGAEAGGSLDRIGREAERLNELIGQLLALTRMEREGGPGERVPVALDELVAGVAQDADFEARGRGRSVAVGRCDGATAEGSPELLRRAVENVVRNAVRFTAEGTAVEVSLARTAEGAARIAVRDRGPGVPPEALTELFRPFYRVADARDRQTGGTGLGLAIAERAVRLHGGTIRAANAPGGGLEVTIELPSAGA